MDEQTLENHGCRMMASAFNRCQPNLPHRVAAALVDGASPHAAPISPTSPPYLLTAINKGEVEIVAMLLCAGADLSAPIDRLQPGGLRYADAIKGNERDLERAESNEGFASMMSFPRVANAREMARLCSADGLASWVEMSAHCKAIAEAAKTPRIDRLREAYKG